MERREPIHLTKREHQVLALILSGQATAEIAKTLGIATTVTTYKKRLYSKSGTNSLSQLLIWAMVGPGGCKGDPVSVELGGFGRAR